MLGYNASMTVKEKRDHHKKLTEMLPDKKKELAYAYSWMSNRIFLDAVSSDNPSQYEFATAGMIHPPLKLLQSLKECSSKPKIELKQPTFELAHPLPPKCNLCEEKLAENICTKIDYSILKCSCGQQWCHVKCCEQLLMNKPQCYLCKKYFTLSTMKNSSLQQTLLRF